MTMVCPRCWGSTKEPRGGGSTCTHCSGIGACNDTALSTNFLLSEFLKSQTAVRLGIPNDPSSAVIGNLQNLVIRILQPLRDAVGSLSISSGYRALPLNTAVGSHPSSAHVVGHGADIEGPCTRKELVDDILRIGFKFDQVIFEGTWVHVGIYNQAGEQRNQVLATYDGGKTYVPYDPKDPRIHT